MHTQSTISVIFLVASASLTACVQEGAARKKLVSLDAKAKVCLLDVASDAKAIPEPQTIPELTIADDIHMAYNCSERLDIKWEKSLRTQDLLLNGKVLVYGSNYGCTASDSIPSITYPNGIESKLEQSIDAYNTSAKKKMIQSNESLNAAIKAAKSCSFKSQGDLLVKLNSKRDGLMLDQTSNESPTATTYKILSESILLDELACLGTLT
ncbi:MAG: hypothetical protein EOP09_19480, partial [Proteobacteria bacterium]